jgi:uncharacterized SAM-binding protein YcdF (DUF218 family)
MRTRKMMALVAAAPVVALIALAFRVDRAARVDPPSQGAQAIVVLGARVLPSGHAAPALQRRAEMAAELFKAGRAPVLVFSGGASGSQPSEARIARDIAVSLGVPTDACVLEESSHSTAENAALTVPLLEARGIKDVLLVSDGYHLLRARAHFSALGITAHPVASGRPLNAGGRVYWTLREVAALLRRPWLLWT